MKAFSVKLASVALLILAMLSHADAGPADTLRGKSVKLAWSERVTFVIVASGRENSASLSQTLTIYVSSAGRVFARRTVNDQGGGSAITGDRVNASSSSSDGRLATFQAAIKGDKIVAVRHTSSGSAVMVEVSFNPDFSTCSATIHHGSQAGTSKSYHGLRTGMELRLISTVADTPSCSVQGGNAL